MTRSDRARSAFGIGDWWFEPDLDRLSRGRESISLRPRVTELLLCLAERAGALASKRQLLDDVWGTDFVTENALTHLVAELRAALGDDARDPRYVETIPRRGYRLVAPVKKAGGGPTPFPGEPPRFLLILDDGTEIVLEEGEHLIGRGPEANVRVDLSEVSRRHALLVVDGTNAILEDLGSKNGTRVRGRRVEGRRTLEDADEIQLGLDLARLRFRVLDAATRTERTPGD